MGKGENPKPDKLLVNTLDFDNLLKMIEKRLNGIDNSVKVETNKIYNQAVLEHNLINARLENLKFRLEAMALEKKP